MKSNLIVSAKVGQTKWFYRTLDFNATFTSRFQTTTDPKLSHKKEIRKKKLPAKVKIQQKKKAQKATMLRINKLVTSFGMNEKYCDTLPHPFN